MIQNGTNRCVYQAAEPVDLDARIKEEETDPFLKENGEGVKKLWKHVAECGESTFPNPPCLIIAAEWRGARRQKKKKKKKKEKKKNKKKKKKKKQKTKNTSPPNTKQ